MSMSQLDKDNSKELLKKISIKSNKKNPKRKINLFKMRKIEIGDPQPIDQKNQQTFKKGFKKP